MNIIQVLRVAVKDRWDDIFDRVESYDTEVFFVRLAYDGRSQKLLTEVNSELLNPVHGTPGWKRRYGKESPRQVVFLITNKLIYGMFSYY